ncbi:hypothetical protein OBV_27150 [Oscillibacter valericigenes Sjm18-20]|nr:hypothetical protein OBV_27150 [Oscillibacter valericigenes Sjm18-20]
MRFFQKPNKSTVAYMSRLATMLECKNILRLEPNKMEQNLLRKVKDKSWQAE